MPVTAVKSNIPPTQYGDPVFSWPAFISTGLIGHALPPNASVTNTFVEQAVWHEHTREIEIREEGRTEGVESAVPLDDDGLRSWDGCVDRFHVSGRPRDQCRPGVNDSKGRLRGHDDVLPLDSHTFSFPH